MATVVAHRPSVVAEPAPEALHALIGERRASLLLLIDTPRTAGEIAQALKAVPGAVTHHLRELEASGLVIRIRRGRHVFVERTSRGSALLALYQDSNSVV